MTQPAKVGVFGGSFDPPHNGHLALAQAAFDSLGLDYVLWVPAGDQYQKQHVAPAEVRAALVSAAIAPYPHFRLEFADIERPGPTYTVDLLRELTERDSNAEYWLLMGQDSWESFSTWREPAEICSLAKIAVVDRALSTAVPDAQPTSGERQGFSPRARIEMPNVSISSTECRSRLNSGHALAGWIPASVEAICNDTQQYRSA